MGIDLLALIKKKMKLSDYEIEVLKLMLKNEFSNKEIDEICKSEIRGYEFTGSGYFLQLKNKIFTVNRKVISEPIIIGRAPNYDVGFVLFMEKKTLTIECHSWGYKNPTKNIRQERITIEISQ